MALAGDPAGARAQTSPAPPGAVGVDTGLKTNSDPVVAEVDGQSIHLSEVGDAIRAMPGGGKGNSLETLYPVALRQAVEREALVIQAHADGVANDATVRRHMREAADQVLEDAYLHHATAKLVTEQMLSARYDAEIRGKPGPEEVRARVILVPTEAEARDIIARLAAGADFAALARQSSIDLTARMGGDLGFVRRDALGPEVGAVLFALRPGEVTPHPVRTAAGWFVLQAQARRFGPTPTFAEARDRLEAEGERDEVGAALRAVLSRMMVRTYNIHGP
ncbi:MAG TPA: peptidylprolyl isomerase [Acetobacteraceae bacterium]|nr:peptidylprolyl isomerase [Acetobacteraceae bacterium]